MPLLEEAMHAKIWSHNQVVENIPLGLRTMHVFQTPVADQIEGENFFGAIKARLVAEDKWMRYKQPDFDYTVRPTKAGGLIAEVMTPKSDLTPHLHKAIEQTGGIIVNIKSPDYAFEARELPPLLTREYSKSDIQR